MSKPVRLHPDDLEALVQRVAELVAGAPAKRWLTAAEVAERLGVIRDYVYDHAVELGAQRIGDGPRPRLRFDPAKVDAAIASRDTGAPSSDTSPASRSLAGRPASTRNGVKLLPIRRIEA